MLRHLVLASGLAACTLTAPGLAATHREDRPGAQATSARTAQPVARMQARSDGRFAARFELSCPTACTFRSSLVPVPTERGRLKQTLSRTVTRGPSGSVAASRAASRRIVVRAAVRKRLAGRRHVRMRVDVIVRDDAGHQRRLRDELLVRTR